MSTKSNDNVSKEIKKNKPFNQDEVTRSTFYYLQDKYKGISENIGEWSKPTQTPLYPLTINKIGHNFKMEKQYKVKDNENLYSIFVDRAKRIPNEAVYEFKSDPSSTDKKDWKSITGYEFLELINKVAKGLIQKGYKKGDSIAIISQTRFEWVVIDQAALAIGCVTIPIYETDSVEQIENIVKDSNTKLVVAENSKLAKKVHHAVGKLGIEIHRISHDFIGKLIELGESVSDKELKARTSAVVADDLSTIIYTSGSTGTPKGVEITHRAMISCALNARESLAHIAKDENGELLFFLPLAHGFGRFIIFTLASGNLKMSISSMGTLLEDISTIGPKYTIGVPRVFEKIINAASQKAGKGIKGSIFSQALKVATKYSEALDTKEGVSFQLKFLRNIYDKLVYGQIRSVLGGKLEMAVCGGAPLSPNIAHFFRGIGITLLEGYGLTETVSAAFCSRPTANSIGSIGFPFPSIKIKISKEGELLIQTEAMFKGYHNDPEATASVLKKGWLHTGDLVKENPDKSISIIGRKKELIVTAGGKNVSPYVLESALKDALLVSNCVLVGDQKPFISALITLDKDELKSLIEESGEKIKLHDAPSNQFVISKVQEIVDTANALVSRAESIRKFVILPDDFSEDNGLLTPSMKIKRKKILEHYDDLIAKQIYS
jgi:long-chain acyl-CoA synthetase